MFTIMIVFHVIICISLMVVVLMQSAKGEGLAGGTAFGGALSGAVFGGRGAASFLSKATTVLAVVFMLNCGALALMSSRRGQSIDPTQVTESTVTRKTQEEMDRQLQRQQQLQEAARQDSLAKANIQVLPGEAAPAQPDSN